MNENANRNKRKRSNIIQYLCLGAAIALLFAAVFFICRRQEQKTAETYAQGIAAIENGDYQAAIDLFDEVYGYRNAKDLSKYCYAVLRYSETDYRSVSDSIKWLDQIPAKYQGDLAAVVNEFRKTANQTMAKFEKEEQARIAAQEAEWRAEREREFQEKLRTSKPWFGMSEKYIDQTVLGEHSKYVGNSHYHNYYWSDYYAQVEVKTGKVVKVAVIIYDSPNTSSKSGSGHSVTFEGNNYADAEDFYYWERDNFVDFEEAEDYFYSH